MFRTPTGFLACVLALGLAVPANAWRAEAERPTQVREAPSHDAEAIWVLYSGEKVSVDRCEDGYCFIRRNSREGWVKLSVLDRSRPPKDRRNVYVPDEPGDDYGGGGNEGGGEGGDGDYGDDDCGNYNTSRSLSVSPDTDGAGVSVSISAVITPCDD